jgi:dihydrolipoamide dehydrogenase
VLGEGKVSVTGDDGKTQELEAKNIVIATGSDVAGIPGVKVDIDEKVIVSSTGRDRARQGARPSGRRRRRRHRLEMGSVWARLGAKVTVVEYLDTILGGMDGDVAKQFQRILAKQGMEFKLGAKVTGVEKSGKGAKVSFEPVKGGDAETIDADVVLIATGRKPYTEGLGLEEAGVVLDERGRVRTDHHYQTNVPGVYAIGDVIAGPMLAHKAEDEGVALAEIMAGQARPCELRRDPGRGLHPAGSGRVGKTEEELKADGIKYKTGKFPFSANGRARAMQALGRLRQGAGGCRNRPGAGRAHHRLRRGRLIHEAAVLMEFGGSSEDLGRTCHAHPTMSEAVQAKRHWRPSSSRCISRISSGNGAACSMKAREIPLSLPHPAFPGADWGDCFETLSDDPALPAVAAARRAFEKMPRWIGGLMTLRNLLVRPFGLKGEPEAASQGSGRVGIFPIIRNSPEQCILGLDDRHLDFRIVVETESLPDSRTAVRMMTLVKRHNLHGRLYLAVIMPFHKLIVKTALSRV